MSSSYQDLAREITRTRRIAETRGAPQIIHSTIEGGAVPIRDADGNLTGLVGEQYDGTFGSVTLGGPKPPIPSAPSLFTANSGVRVTWDGSFQDPQPDWASPVVAPQDFKRVAVEVANNVDFIDARHAGDFISAGGSEIFVTWTPGEQVYARLICWSHSGKFSASSLITGPVASGKIGVGDVSFDLSQLGGTTIHYGPTDPSIDPAVTLGYGDLWLQEVDDDPSTYKIQRWSVVSGADAWVELVDQGIAAAAAAAVAAKNAADANARYFTQATKPVWTGAANTAVWIDTANGNQRKVWDGADFVARPLGTGAFEPNSLVASDILATGTIDASLLAALVVLANQAVVVGNPDGTHTRLDGPSASLVAYAESVIAGQAPAEVARFGASSGGRDPATGRVTWSVDQRGHGSFTSVSVEGELRVGGDSIIDLLADSAGNVLDRYSDTLGTDLGPIGEGEVGIVEINGYLTAGRIYELSHRVTWAANDAHGVEATIRPIWTGPTAAGSNTAATPMVTGTPKTVTAYYHWGPTMWGRNSHAASTLFEPTVTGRHRFLLAIRKSAGPTSTIVVVGDRDIEFWLTDKGPKPPGAGGTVSRGGGTLSGGAPPPPPPAPKVTRTDTWVSVWSRSWRQNGAISFNGPMYQGYGDSFNGIQSSSVGFPDLVGTLSGATIHKVEIFLHAEHWYSFAGGTAIIGHHGALALPAGFPGTNGVFSVPGWARNQGRWLDVTGWGAGLKAGTIRGVSLTSYLNSTSTEFYGRFSGHGGHLWPSIRIKYTK